MKGRVLAYFLVVSLVLTMVPGFAIAAEDALNISEQYVCTADDDCTAQIHTVDCPQYVQINKGENGFDGIPLDKNYIDKMPNEDGGLIVTSDNEYQEELSYRKVLIVSTNGEFKTIQEALNSLTEDVNGSVLLQVEEDLNSNMVCSIPADKGITSLTLGTVKETGVVISGSNSYIEANGVPVIINTGVTFEGTVFGGGATPVVSGGTSITIKEGAKVDTIYGGGRESDVTGNVSITIYGEVTDLYGGGYVYAYTSDGDKTADANVDGDIQINISGEQSVLNRRLVGGGNAYSSTENKAAQKLKANVTGDITIYLDCPSIGSNAKINGGGKAELSTTLSNLPNMDNRNLEANVTGGIIIKLGGNGKTTSADSLLSLWGGGYASTPINGNNDIVLENTTVVATVTGDTNIDASENFDASSGEDGREATMFSCLYGGAYSKGRYTEALLDGNTSLVTSRKVINSNSAVFGGGNAFQGGLARVTGNTEVRICRVANQADGHENAKGVIGGGHAGINSDATVEGNTKVVIDNGIALESSGPGIIGGGWAMETAAVANVLGNIDIQIQDNLNTYDKIVGGGYASAENTIATVSGNINIQMKGNLKSSSTFVGGGYALGKNSIAKVGSEERKSIIITQLQGKETENEFAFYNSGFFGAGYARNDGADATVYADVTTTFDNAKTGSSAWFWGGGFCSATANAEVVGDVTINIQNHSNMPGIVLGGGWTADSALQGKTSVNIKNSTCGKIYGGGYLGNVGNVQIQVVNSMVSGYLYGGGNKGNIGSAQIQIKDSSLESIIGGSSNSVNQVKSATIEVLGNSALTLNPGSLPEDGVILNVGNGSVETNAKIKRIKEPAVEQVHIFNKATLEHPIDAANKLFDNGCVKDLRIDEGGNLNIENHSEEITGNFTGGGTIKMKAGNLLTINGMVSGKTTLKINGTPIEGQIYIQAKDGGDGNFTLDSGQFILEKTVADYLAKWRIAEGIIVNVSNAGNGTVTPAGSVAVAPGDQQVFTFIPNYGYKLSSVKVDGQEVMDQITDNVYIMNVTKACTLSVEFRLLEADDMGGMIDDLPNKPDLEPADRETVLDAKLHYEALPDSTKEQLMDEKLVRLNNELAQLAEVKVEVNIDVQVEDHEVIKVPDANMLLQAMTAPEAVQLKNGHIQEYKLTLLVAKTGNLSDQQNTALAEAKDGAIEGKQYDITVEKSITKNGQPAATQKLAELDYPVTLVFDVSDQQPTAGYKREWSVLNLHGEDNHPIVIKLKDQDNQKDSVTVTSDKFSVYTLVYKDSKSGSSGASSTAYYTLTAKASTGGAVSPNGKIAIARNSDKTFTFTPADGYEIDNVLVDGKSIGVVDSYKFEGVTKNHTIEVSFKVKEPTGKPGWNPFTDVRGSDWFHNNVKYVYEKGLMNGVSDTIFAPQMDTSRGMIVTILWRLEDNPQTPPVAFFTDVTDEDYFSEAVTWANKNKIVQGYGDHIFGPNDPITREQIAAILYRYAQYKNYEVAASGNLSLFTDADSVSDYAVKAVQWAVGSGLLNGNGDGTLNPRDNATRAEVAAILMRLCEDCIK